MSPTGTNSIFPGYSESVLSTKSDFCSQAPSRLQLVNQLIPTNLNKLNKVRVNNLNNHNNLHNDNNSNNLNKTEIFTIMTIITIISRITILRIVICFQRRHESTAESNDLDPVSVCAEAEKKSKTREYQTGSRVTTKAPLSVPQAGV